MSKKVEGTEWSWLSWNDYSGSGNGGWSGDGGGRWHGSCGCGGEVMQWLDVIGGMVGNSRRVVVVIVGVGVYSFPP